MNRVRVPFLKGNRIYLHVSSSPRTFQGHHSLSACIRDPPLAVLHSSKPLIVGESGADVHSSIHSADH